MEALKRKERRRPDPIDKDPDEPDVGTESRV